MPGAAGQIQAVDASGAVSFQDKDQVIHLKGTAAARPAASALLKGATYFETDTAGGTMFRCTGAAWEQVSKGMGDVDNLAGTLHTLLPWVTTEYNPSNASGTFFLYGTGALAATADGSPLVARYLNPADYPVPAGKTVKYTMNAFLVYNSTAPGAVTFRAGLYALSAPTGAAGVLTATFTLVTGSEVVFNTPPANANLHGVVEFNAPAAGLYAIGANTNAVTAASSDGILGATLQMRRT